MKSLFSVAGKVAIVTGGSRGIGAMIARGFVENGAKTYITARKVEELEATAKELSQYGECIAIASDLSSLDGIKGFCSEIMQREQQVDILINNAGATWGAPIADFPESGWDKVMDLNVKSPFFLVQQLLPALKAAGDQEDPARVINISSINAYANPKMTNYSYSASKAAIAHLTRHMAADLVKDNITVNAIAPGEIDTSILSPGTEKIVEEIPMRRLGQPAEVAETIFYLCSPQSSYVTGAEIHINGGQHV